MTLCKFCDEPAERVCAWVIGETAPYRWNGDRWAGASVRCDVPVCFRHMIEPGEIAYCADHWHFAEKASRPVPEHWVQHVEANPDFYNSKPKRRSVNA